MNKTILEGKWRQVRGDLKTRWAKLTDDDRRMLDGKLDQMVGLFEERYGYTQQAAADALAHYLGGYGKSGRRHTAEATRYWRPLLAVVGMITLFTAGGFALTRLLSARRGEAGQEHTDQESIADTEALFG